MELLEHVLVELRPRLAHGGVGNRPRLRQGHLEGPALSPQLGQRGGVALAAGGEHEAEHEQHHQQRVEHPAALAPAAVVFGGQGAQRADQTLPEVHETRVGGRVRGRGPAALRAGLRALLQDLAAALRQRVQVHVLGVAPGRGPPLRAPGQPPVGGAVAGAGVALRIDEGLQQDRSPRVAPLPVDGQLPRRQRQRLRRQALHAHPGKQQEARLRDDELQMLLVGALRPAHPSVAAGQRVRGLAEQQAARAAPPAVEHEVAQVRAPGLLVAEVVVALDELVPQPGLLRRDQLQAQRQQVPQRLLEARAGRGAGGERDRLARTLALLLFPLRRQRQDGGLLQLLEHAQGRADPVAAGGRAPVQMLADRVGQFHAAQGGAGRHRRLNVGDLLAAEAPPEEGGGWQTADAGVHASS